MAILYSIVKKRCGKTSSIGMMECNKNTTNMTITYYNNDTRHRFGSLLKKYNMVKVKSAIQIWTASLCARARYRYHNNHAHTVRPLSLAT